MTKIMQKTYRIISRAQRRGKFYLHNAQTGERESLETTDRQEAQKICDARNLERQTPDLNLKLGLAYLTNADPQNATRTWATAMTELCSRGIAASQTRCKREMDSKAYDHIRNMTIVGTRAEDLKLVLKKGGNATNNYLRRLHNLALDNGWLHYHIISPKKWDKPVKKPKRGVTSNEYALIIAAEQNDERRSYYQMLWETGGAQTDISLLTAEHFDTSKKLLTYQRKKTGEWCHLRIGANLEALLKKLPKQGFLFPKIAASKDKDRSAEFARRRRLLKLSGISLHSFRYAWAERAYAAGYPERYAQAALGHSSACVHHAYAKSAKVICPPLETLNGKLIPFVDLQLDESPQQKTA